MPIWVTTVRWFHNSSTTIMPSIVIAARAVAIIRCLSEATQGKHVAEGDQLVPHLSSLLNKGLTSDVLCLFPKCASRIA